MKRKWDAGLTAVLLLCAVSTTVAVGYRVFVTSHPGSANPVAKSMFIQNWKEQLTGGVRIGSETAPVQLTEFADFECPFCGAFHRTWKVVRDRYQTEIALTYMHFPLPGHRFAVAAARVAECAADQGRFEAMYDQLFDGQDSFGLKPWSDYASAAGVPDIPAFDACIKSGNPLPRIEKDKQLGAKLDVKGTPTLIVNGWMLARPPTTEELDAMVKAILSGKSPVPAKT
jgi:protein-disulfide isomerase